MTDIIPSMASHFLFCTIQDKPYVLKKITHALTENNPNEIPRFLAYLSGLIAGYVHVLEKVNPEQKRINQEFCQMLKDFPIQKISEENVSYRR